MKSRAQLNRPLNVLTALLLSLVAAIFTPSASAQKLPQCTVKPASIPLGQMVRLRCELPAATARADVHLNGGPDGRTVRLFKEEGGDWEGLMPVAVEDVPGTYPIEFLAADGTTLA